MSTTQILLTKLPQTSEVNLVKMIEDFAHSRTVLEIKEDIEKIIASLNGHVHGITPGGFRWTLNVALMVSTEHAKNMFIRQQYDSIEWQRLGPALETFRQ